MKMAKITKFDLQLIHNVEIWLEFTHIKVFFNWDKFFWCMKIAHKKFQFPMQEFDRILIRMILILLTITIWAFTQPAADIISYLVKN